MESKAVGADEGDMSDIYMHRLIELLHKSKYTCTGVQLIYCRNYVVSVSNLHSFSSLVLDHFRLTCDRRTQQQASKLASQRYPKFNCHLLLALPSLPFLYPSTSGSGFGAELRHLVLLHSEWGRRSSFFGQVTRVCGPDS